MSVVIPAVLERIQARLGGRVVGYACCLGSLTEGVQTAAHGDAWASTLDAAESA